MATSNINLMLGTPIVATMTSLTTLASSTSVGAQCAKIDLGTQRAESFVVRLGVNFATAPTAGGAIEVYVGFSSSSTAATGNPGALTGADAAWTGYGNDVAQAKQHLEFVGIMSVSAISSTTVQQVKDIGVFTPLDRYAMIAVINSADKNLSSLAAMQSVVITPLMDQAQ